MNVVSFKTKWSKLKRTLMEDDIKYFEVFIDIEGRVGKVMTLSERQYNPFYNVYWFPVSRCHWAVIFPAYLLNNRSHTGRYKILTNNEHSVVFDSETQEVFDPTYEFNKIDFNSTKEKFQNGFEIIELSKHLEELNY